MAPLTPPEKAATHGTFVRYLLIFTAFIGSLAFVNGLATGAVFYHLYQKLTGQETLNEPEDEQKTSRYQVREAYPNIKDLKATKDLRYYALQLGLDLEEHIVTTADGYVLVLHHLIDPAVSAEDRVLKRPVLLQHGLLSCSGAWLASGRNSLAYHFVETGHDVWLGNNRSGFDVKHTTYDGNLMHNEQYWDWDVRDLGYYDLPCIIDNVLAHKPNHDKVVLVGHSQGCTQTFLMLRNEELAPYHNKVEYFFPVAPAVFPGKLFHERRFLKFLHNRSKAGYRLIFGHCSFLRNLGLARYYLASTAIFGWLSYVMFKFLFGWLGKRWGKERKVRHVLFIFNVSYVSSKLMSWWVSYWRQEGFSNQLQTKEAYASGRNYATTPTSSIRDGVEPVEVDDSHSFFPYKQQWFPSSLVVPMVAFVADEDYLVDGNRFASHMLHYERAYYQQGRNLEVVHLAGYNHLDVIWAEDVIGKIGYVITDKLEQLEHRLEKAVQHESIIPDNQPLGTEEAKLHNEELTV